MSFNISIHAPREGSDSNNVEQNYQNIQFQSTLPVRGATIMHVYFCFQILNFNPRSP